MKLEICHYDTCLPDYFSGHHNAYIQIPAYNGMSLKEVKQGLRNEIAMGAVGGNDRIAYLLSSDYVQPSEEKEATKAVYAAINRMKPSKKGQRKFFTDLEKDIDNVFDSVYAYFLIVDSDE